LIITASYTYNSQDIAEIIGCEDNWQSAPRSELTGVYFTLYRQCEANRV